MFITVSIILVLALAANGWGVFYAWRCDQYRRWAGWRDAERLGRTAAAEGQLKIQTGPDTWVSPDSAEARRQGL